MSQRDIDPAVRERAIHAAVIEMSLFSGNLEMKVRKAIERYEMVLREADPPEPDAVRYVRADLYGALQARAQQDCLQWLGELGADYR